MNVEGLLRSTATTDAGAVAEQKTAGAMAEQKTTDAGAVAEQKTAGAGAMAEQKTTAPQQLTELERKLETKWLYSLLTLSQQTSVQRGLLIPLYGKIMTLGVSLILQLRSLGVELPIEIPHCGDFAH